MTAFSESNNKSNWASAARTRPHNLIILNGLLSPRRTLLPLVFAALYASILTGLPVDAFKDRHNYILYAEVSDAVLYGYARQGWNVVLANEPIWRLMNIALSKFFEAEETVRILIFVPAFIVPFVILRNHPKHAGWLIVFLLIPQVMKFHVIQLRQGFAVSVFLLGYYSKPNWLRFLLMGMSGFIHSSFLVVGLIGVFSWLLRTLRLSSGLRVFLFVLAFAVVGYSLQSIAANLGARQGERYSNIDYDISGLGFVFWASIFTLYVSAGRSYVLNWSFPIAVLAFYLPSYFFTPISARIFESVILLVLISGLSLHGWRRQMFLTAVLFYAFFMYLQRIGQPWLGWGVSSIA